MKVFFSGHSLRRTGTSRLFQAGVQRKIVKECSGHTSDAVDKYQITSDHQRQCVSKILQSKPMATSNSSNATAKEVRGDAVEVSDPQVDVQSNKSAPKSKECNCQSSSYGGWIDQLIAQVNASGKVKIKIEIEVSKD